MAGCTKQFKKRNAILSYLKSVDTHPSAEMVFTHLKQEIPDLSLGTVYRNLSLFKNQGLVQSVATVKGIERFDGCAEPHVHFICTCCDSVIDLHDMEIPLSLLSAGENNCGGRVESCQLSFVGTCRECLVKGESA